MILCCNVSKCNLRFVDLCLMLRFVLKNMLMHTGVLLTLWKLGKTFGWPPRIFLFVLAPESFPLSGVALLKCCNKLVILHIVYSCLRDGTSMMFSMSLN